MTKQLTFFILLITLSCNAQHTLSLKENQTSPAANLNQVAWIQGHWRAEVFGGTAEEIWSPPLGGSMMFSFKLVVDNKVQFYELGGIRQVDNTLLLQLKHFNTVFKGWETKDETVDFKLVKIEPNIVYFEGFTIKKENKNNIVMYVKVDGKEIAFNYKKQ